MWFCGKNLNICSCNKNMNWAQSSLSLCLGFVINSTGVMDLGCAFLTDSNPVSQTESQCEEQIHVKASLF